MNCDRIARWYRIMEYCTLGPALERRRRQFINDVADARRVLILGDGDGRFIAEFLKTSRACVVDFVELSTEMIRLARERVHAVPTRATMRFLQGDAVSVPLFGPYDLIVSHFFLDCFTTSQVEELVKRLLTLAPEARWVISEFRIPATGLGHLAGTLLVGFLYRVFRWLTGLQVKHLSDYPCVLQRAGFEQCGRQNALGGLLVSELWQLKRAVS